MLRIVHRTDLLSTNFFLQIKQTSSCYCLFNRNVKVECLKEKKKEKQCEYQSQNQKDGTSR